jgi:hypothetical protein
MRGLVLTLANATPRRPWHRTHILARADRRAEKRSAFRLLPAPAIPRAAATNRILTQRFSLWPGVSPYASG